jgi:hypothetical protein
LPVGNHAETKTDKLRLTISSPAGTAGNSSSNTMNKLTSIIVAGVAAACWSASAADADHHDEWDISKLDAGKLPPAAKTAGLTYDKDIKPMLEASCFRCHGEERQRGELRLDSREALLKGGENGKIVEPGNSKKSIMLFAAAQVNDDVAMPPKRRPGGRGPGGRGDFQPPPEVIKKYDKDGDGKLNDAERQAMMADFRAQRGGGGPGGPQGQGRGPGGPGGPGGGPGGRGGFGPPPKPLTPEQVGILRAWIDQGAK